MDGKGSGQNGQGGDTESARGGPNGLAYARRGPEARSEYPMNRRGEGSNLGSRAGSDFANQGPGEPSR